MAETANFKQKRRRYLIDKKFQGAFIMRFSFLVLIGGVITIAIMYSLALQTTTVGFFNSRVQVHTTADYILPLLTQTVLMVSIVVGITAAIMTILVSHKISGPMYRLNKVMESMSTGDFSSEFHIRKSDQLQECASIFNTMIHNTKYKLSHLKSQVTSLNEKLAHLSDDELPENKRHILKELKSLSIELDNVINHFKT